VGRAAPQAALGAVVPGHPLIPAARADAPRVADVPAPAFEVRDASREGLYVHVPFCAVRCAYCDFATGPLSAEKLERYLVAVGREASRRAAAAAGVRFRTVFFGGGTPSALSARHFRRLWTMLAGNFEIHPAAEITLEANPETVNDALLAAWREAGVNRLSMGAQSFVPGELERLGRIHGPERPFEAVARARRAGFERLSVDLMFGFPGHTAAAWRHTLARTLELGVEHVSAYCFIPEDETPLGGALLRGEVTLPGPDEQAERYAELVETLTGAGYAHYETSNFARPGGEARHNLVYWLRRRYLSLGPSAHGMWDRVRYADFRGFERWAAALQSDEPCDERDPETDVSVGEEIVMLALRLGSGLQERDHDPGDWARMSARYAGPLRQALEEGRLERCEGGLRVPPRHRFMADDVIAWLMARAASCAG
jgi:oxygen-independent coproporphyrinogen-3 oxidase